MRQFMSRTHQCRNGGIAGRKASMQVYTTHTKKKEVATVVQTVSVW